MRRTRSKEKGAAKRIDNDLMDTASDTTKSYDADAQAIARVLRRHFGDEATAVLDRARHFLDGG